MTQKIHHDKYFQLGKIDENTLISAGIIDMQTRDGVDEAIVGAGAMVFDPSIGDDGMWVPVSQANPLHTKAHDTDQALQQLKQALGQTLAVEFGEAQPVFVEGTATRISSAPIVGMRTVTSVAAELFAGSSRKTGRALLMVRNTHPSLRIRVGPSSLSDQTGFGVEPEAVLT